MSMLLMVEAMKVKVGNPLRKLVLIKLADNANDKGECFPSVAYIAEQCEISERSVQNHIKQLEVDGLIKIESRKSENGLNKSNIYYLNFSGANPAPITSHIIEPVKEPVNNLVINGFDFSGLDGMLEKNLIDDFIKFRKSIKKPLTQGAVNYLIRELNKAVRAGYNPNELIEMTLSRGWQTFEYRYLNNQQQTPNGTQSKFMTLAERNRAVLESMRS